MKKGIVLSVLVMALGGCNLLQKGSLDGGGKLDVGYRGANNDQAGGETKMVEGYGGEVVAGESAPLLVYNKADYEKALSEGKLVLLYFYANWCPICRVETKESLYPAFNELTSDQVVGFRVNFKDSETDSDEQAIARELGIPYQHHKVIIKNGQTVVSSPQEWDKARYLNEINSKL